MKSSRLSLSLVCVLAASPLNAGLELVPQRSVPALWGGATQPVAVLFRNPASNELVVALAYRLHQAASATAQPLGPVQPWRTLRVLPGQTVLERAEVLLPEVPSETRGLLRWQDDHQHALGATEIRIVPRGLLSEFNVLRGTQPLGLIDPERTLAPTLEHERIPFVDLAETEDRPAGRLLLVVASVNPDAAPGIDDRKLRRWVGSGLALVWIKPGGSSLIDGVVQLRWEHAGTAVIGDLNRIEALSSNASAQVYLLSLARLALEHHPLDLFTNTP